MASIANTNNPQYTIERLPPLPASVIAPHGFPADPRPSGAPKVFRDAMHVRIEVFCNEQKCSEEPELDEDDLKSYHWVMYQTGPASDTREPLSVLRIVLPPHGPHPNGYEDPDEEPYAKLGRVSTLKHARGRGLSKRLFEEAAQWLSEHSQEVGHGWKGLILAHAQVYVEDLYKKWGFVTDEKLGRWDEEEIEHVGMWKRLPIDS